jgi:hypothetical protein
MRRRVPAVLPARVAESIEWSGWLLDNSRARWAEHRLQLGAEVGTAPDAGGWRLTKTLDDVPEHRVCEIATQQREDAPPRLSQAGF